MAQGPKAVAVDRIMQKIEKLKARAERFGDEVEDSSNNAIKHLENRVGQLRSLEKPEEIRKNAAIIEDSLYLYGTDFMSTENIKEYMGLQFPDLSITWINDSSCTIKFNSADQAADAFKKFSIRPAVLESSAKEEQAFDERNFDSRTGWREALSYQHGRLGWQALWIRFATDLDVKKEETKGENSRFYKYQRKQQERRNPGLRHKAISKPDKTIVDKKEESKPLLGAEDDQQPE